MNMTINIFDKVFEVVKNNTSIDTQKDLALVLGVTQQSISDARTRGRFPMEWLIKMCVIYNINLDAMLGLNGNGNGHGEQNDKLISTLIENLKVSIDLNVSIQKKLSAIEEKLDYLLPSKNSEERI